MMKILLCHNYYQQRSGEYHVLLREKRLLECNGHTVILYTRDSNELAGAGILTRLLAALQAIFSIRTFREVLQIVRTQRPDLAHIQGDLRIRLGPP